MRNLWLLGFFGLFVGVIVIVSSDSDSEGNVDGGILSFLKSFKEVKLTFPTGTGDDTITLKLKPRPGTVRPNLKAALDFLHNNYSHMETYKVDVYDCKQFALRLFEDIEKANFEAKYVIISLIDQSEGHAVAGIVTSDAGILYVDFTPFLMTNKEQKPSRTIAQVKAGMAYLRMPIESLPPDFRNEDRDFASFETQIRHAEGEIADYNAQLKTLEDQKKDLEKKIGDFNGRVSRGIAQNEYEAIKREQDTIQQDVTDINGRYDVLFIREESLKASYSTFDWIGKNWIVKTVKIFP